MIRNAGKSARAALTREERLALSRLGVDNERVRTMEDLQSVFDRMVSSMLDAEKIDLEKLEQVAVEAAGDLRAERARQAARDTYDRPRLLVIDGGRTMQRRGAA